MASGRRRFDLARAFGETVIIRWACTWTGRQLAQMAHSVEDPTCWRTTRPPTRTAAASPIGGELRDLAPSAVCWSCRGVRSTLPRRHSTVVSIPSREAGCRPGQESRYNHRTGPTADAMTIAADGLGRHQRPGRGGLATTRRSRPRPTVPWRWVALERAHSAPGPLGSGDESVRIKGRPTATAVVVAVGLGW